MKINLLSYPPCTVYYCCCQIPPPSLLRSFSLFKAFFYGSVILGIKLENLQPKNVNFFQKDLVYSVINYCTLRQDEQDG